MRAGDSVSAPCCTFSMSVVEPGEPGDEAPPATRDSSSDSECENDTRTPIVKRSESHLDAAHAVGGRSWASRALRFVAQDAAVMRECGWLLARSVAASLAAATPAVHCARFDCDECTAYTPAAGTGRLQSDVGALPRRHKLIFWSRS